MDYKNVIWAYKTLSWRTSWIQIEKINNCFRLKILKILMTYLRKEYKDVLRNLLFGPIVAINEHRLVSKKLQGSLFTASYGNN